MAQIGTFSKYGIPIFEAEDVQEPAMPVDVGGQIGWINLVPYSKRDKPAVCCKINDELYGSSHSVNLMIDDFEDSDLSEYYSPSSSGSASITSDPDYLLTSNSDHALLMDGDQDLRSMPGDGLPYYPQRGDIFEFYIRPTDFYNTPAFFRMNFGCQGYGTNNLYRIEWESNPTPGSDLSFEKRKYGDNVIIRAPADGAGCRLDQTYRILVDWASSGNLLAVAAYDMSGDIVAPADGTPLTFDDDEYVSGGIQWESNGYFGGVIDTCRTLPP